MGRKSAGPWYWAHRDSWCATIDGSRIILAKGRGAEREARREWHRIMGEGPPARPTSAMPLRNLCNLFLDQVKPRVAEATYTYYSRTLSSLLEAHGNVEAGAMRPYHLDQWLALHDWSQNTRRGAITITKILFRWAKRRGYLESDPMAEVERPGQVRREAIPSPEQALAILGAIRRPPFKDFLLAIWGTGCRPGEAAKVEAKDIDAEGTWVLDGKTTRRTGQKRRVFPPPAIVELCRVKALENPEGPIFRDSHGKPWHRESYGLRMRRLRRKLGMGREVVCYAFRHLFATDAEERGVPPATVAALLGHSSVSQLWTYSKLHARDDHLRDAVDRVRGLSRSGPPAGPGTPGEGTGQPS